MGVAHTLSRTFFWSENILWKDELLSHHATVFLASKDSIINAPLVYEYLQEADGGDGNKVKTERVGFNSDDHSETVVPEKLHGGDDWLNVVWCPNLDHGQIFDLPLWRRQLVEETLAHARGDFPVQHERH
jgi:hypothetical protein